MTVVCLSLEERDWVWPVGARRPLGVTRPRRRRAKLPAGFAPFLGPRGHFADAALPVLGG